MKILFTTFTFAPEGNGVSEVVTAHAAGLAARGHDVTVVTGFNAGRQGCEMPKVKIAEFRAFFDNRNVGGALDPDETRRYRDFLAGSDADVIISHCWGAWSTDYGLEVIARHRAAKIFVSHGYVAHRWHPYPRFPWGIPSYLRGLPYVLTTIRTLKVYDHIVFLSPRVDWGRYFDPRLVKWLGRPDSSVIPNGSYPEQFKAADDGFRDRLGIKGFMILNVGGYYDRKNQPLALRAFLGAGLERATLVFIGNEFNDYSNRLGALNKNLNIDPDRLRVIFLEKQPRAQIQAAYKTADLFILPSTIETQPLVVLDAMAAGTPFLSTDVGSVSELPGGLIARNEQEMAGLLSRLANDTGERKKLAAEGLKAALTRYNWSTAVDQYEALCARLVSRRRSAK